MNCSIIYYAARKTSWCEKALRRSFHEMGLTVSSAVFTTGSEKLGEELIRAFAASDVVFTVGGLDFNDGRGICEIISQAAGRRAAARSCAADCGAAEEATATCCARADSFW